MFKLGSFEEEIAKSMADNLVAKQIEQSKGVLKTAEAVKQTKISRALDHLNSAVQLFDSAGYKVSAKVVAKMMQKVADGKEKGEDPEMIEFKSLLFDDEDKGEEDKDEDLGEQILEFKSLAGKKKA